MHTFTDLANLAAARVGGKVLFANDEFFAPKENLLRPGRGEFIPGKFTSRGKWMDGWETRRRRTPGYDWCVIQLGMPGVVLGVDVDTNHFIGNFPERCSIEACFRPGASSRGVLRGPGTTWVEILPPNTSRAARRTSSRSPTIGPGPTFSSTSIPTGGSRASAPTAT